MADRPGRVAGKVAIVTGGASGLGAESARRLAAEGAAVLLTDRSVEAGEAIARGIADSGGEAVFMAHDVTSEVDWAAVAQAALDRYGKLDILVNNAGVAASGELMTTTIEDWRAILAVNLDGVFLGMRACAPAMAERGGSIINLSLRSWERWGRAASRPTAPPRAAC
jgi:NAD(P)-dependent dehydrogenase (short-subunit alcohol dehydrogenase family)